MPLATEIVHRLHVKQIRQNLKQQQQQQQQPLDRPDVGWTMSYITLV